MQETKDWTGGKTAVYKVIGASNYAVDKEREEDDYYATDPAAIDKLLGLVELRQNVWECACGGGHLSERLKDYGFCVKSTDLKDRGYGESGVDFLKVDRKPIDGYLAIVTNPPYKYATEFVYKALELLEDGDMCCMFLKLTFLEGKARRKLFEQYPPEKVLVFSERIACAKSSDFDRLKKLKANGRSAVAYAWFVWRKGYTGKPTIEWI